MERRKFMVTTMGTLATLSVAGKALADDTMKVENDKLKLSNEIGRNHGHELVLGTLEDLVLLMREANANASGTVALDMQGTSGHPHTLTLSVDDFMTILVDGTLTTQSSVDAGHPHAVRIELKEIMES